MERNKGQNKNNYWLIIILTILIIAFVILSIIYYQKLRNNMIRNKTLISELDSIKKEENTNTENKNNVLKEINELKDLDNAIKTTKEETFSNAKELEQKIINKETTYKIAYLTFDDGPYYNTHKVLDVLKKYKVKVTFFTIGLDKDSCYDNRGQSCKEMYLKEVENGHTIANHTYSHLIFNGLYSSVDSFITQVKKQEELIKDRTGVTTNILRFPGGSGTASAFGVKDGAVSKLKEMGYGWVDWTAGDGDGGYVANTDIAWKNFTGQINEDIEVVLFHDYSTVTLAILPKVIEYLQNKNYILLPLFYDSVKVNK